MCTKSLAAVRQTAQSARGSTGSCGNRSPRSWWGNLPETRRRWPRVRFPPTSPPTFCSGRRPTRSLRSCRTPQVVIGRRSRPAAAALAPEAIAWRRQAVARSPESSDACARLRAPTRHASRRGQGNPRVRARGRTRARGGHSCRPRAPGSTCSAWTPAPRGREPAPSSSTSYGIDRAGETPCAMWNWRAPAQRSCRPRRTQHRRRRHCPHDSRRSRRRCEIAERAPLVLPADPKPDRP